MDDDDEKSIHSSEATALDGRDEEEGNVRLGQLETEKLSGRAGSRTVVTAGLATRPDWTHGVTVTRQVVVESNPR